MLLFDRQFEDDEVPSPSLGGTIAVWLVIALVAANVLSTLAICGFAECPDNPVRYQLFQK